MDAAPTCDVPARGCMASLPGRMDAALGPAGNTVTTGHGSFVINTPKGVGYSIPADAPITVRVWQDRVVDVEYHGVRHQNLAGPGGSTRTAVVVGVVLVLLLVVDVPLVLASRRGLRAVEEREQQQP